MIRPIGELGHAIEHVDGCGARVVFAGGGSGGHLVPGVCVAEEIRNRDDRGCVLFLRGRRQVEGLVLARAPGEVRRLQGLRTPRGAAGRMMFGLRFPLLLARTIHVLRRFRADTVVGLGGYGAVPAVVAARCLGLKVVLLEQNLRPGLATRILGPLADAVCCAFKGTADGLANGLPTGNPVRPPARELDRGAACRRFGLDPERLTLLVAGGSQGARGLNRLVVRGLPALSSFVDRIQVLHLAGAADRESAAAAYRRFGFEARVESFVPDMETAYRVADVALSRAGGTTLAELAACGLPAVLVPYPHHRDRHQHANALAFAAAGAAFVLEEESAGVAELGQTVGQLLQDEPRRARMAAAAARLARPDAVDRVVEAITTGRVVAAAGGAEAGKDARLGS